MTINEYQINAMKFASGMNHQNVSELLVNGVMGMCGESGECIDMVASPFEGIKKLPFDCFEDMKEGQQIMLPEYVDIKCKVRGKIE